MRSLKSPKHLPRPKPPRRSNRGLWPSLGRLLRVYGHSMAPVLNPGELVLVREAEYDRRDPRRGEIVAARPDKFGGRAFVKRITALPNEHVAFDGREWQLGPEQFFLLGDQTEHSLDSRLFGPVTRRELLGPIWARLWPWTVFRRT